MPNTFAQIVFYAYPLIAWVMFRRLPIPAMVAATVVVGYLFLPTRIVFDLPLLPALDRKFMPALAVLLILLIEYRPQKAVGPSMAVGHPAHPVLAGWLPKNKIMLVFLGVLFAGAVMTVIFNTQPVAFGERRLPGLRPYDIFSSALDFLVTLTPFFLARRYLATPQAQFQLLMVLCLCGLIYSLPTLYEVRMSPTINRSIYGFFPTSWRMSLRGDGFRPTVFLDHGLKLGVILAMTLLAAVALFRCAPRYRFLFLGGALWLMGTIFLAKTFGALMIAVAFTPLLLLLNPRLIALASGVIVVCILLFPLLRGADLVPVDRVVNFAANFDTQRAASLQFRLDNEEILLAKANQKPLFGWGGWGRSRVFSEEGDDVGTTDGYWLISLGLGGWARYFAEFGLLSASVLLLAFSRRKNALDMPAAGLCVVMIANLADLIPNAGISPVSWLVAGALAGRLELGDRASETAAATPQLAGDPDERAGPRYSRNHGPPKVRQQQVLHRGKGSTDQFARQHTKKDVS